MVVPRGHPRRVVRYYVDLPQGGCGVSAGGHKSSADSG